MSEKQYLLVKCYNGMWGIYDKKQSAIDNPILIAYSKAGVGFIVNQLNNKNERIRELEKQNQQLKKELKRCREWINSDKNDYELTLAFIKSKGYSLKDVLEYEKRLGKGD